MAKLVRVTHQPTPVCRRFKTARQKFNVVATGAGGDLVRQAAAYVGSGSATGRPPDLRSNCYRWGKSGATWAARTTQENRGRRRGGGVVFRERYGGSMWVSGRQEARRITVEMTRSSVPPCSICSSS